MIPNSQHRLIVGATIDPVWFRFLQSLDGKASAADIAAIATALGSPDGTVANIPPQAGDTTAILQGAGIQVTRDDGGAYSIALRPLGDSGAGTFKLITRDSQGRVSGSEDGAAADVPYDPATSGLAATDVQAAVDELAGTGGYAEGTVNPGSPTLNQKFYRTDLNLLIYYDGTRWLSVNRYERASDGNDYGDPLLEATATSGLAVGRWAMHYSDGIYLERIEIMTFSIAPSGSNKWSFQMSARTASNAATNIGSAVGTSADTDSTWIDHGQTINSVISSSTFQMQLAATRTGAGVTYCLARLVFRLIVT